MIRIGMAAMRQYAAKRRSFKQRAMRMRSRIETRIKGVVFATFCGERSCCSPQWLVAQQHRKRVCMREVMQAMRIDCKKRQQVATKLAQVTTIHNRKSTACAIRQWCKHILRAVLSKQRRNIAVNSYHRTLMQRGVSLWIRYLKSCPSKAQRKNDKLQL